MLKKALVLGGSGFIGSNLYKSEILCNYEVFNLDVVEPNTEQKKWNFIQGDASNFSLLSEYVKKIEPNLIVHLAANSDIRQSSLNSHLDYQNTLLTTMSLVESIIGIPKPEIIFASSSAIYGNSKQNGFASSMKVPISSYGQCKLMSEKILLGAFQQLNISKLLIARFPNVIGQDMTHGLLFDLMKKYNKNQNEIQILGDGTQAKPYMLAEDLLIQVFEDLESTKDIYVFDYGPLSTITVKEISEKLANKLPKKPNLKYETKEIGWVGDVPKYSLAHSKHFRNIHSRSSDEAIDIAIQYLLEENGVSN